MSKAIKFHFDNPIDQNSTIIWIANKILSLLGGSDIYFEDSYKTLVVVI